MHRRDLRFSGFVGFAALCLFVAIATAGGTVEAGAQGKPASSRPQLTGLAGAETQADAAVARCDQQAFDAARNQMMNIVNGEIQLGVQRMGQLSRGGQDTEPTQRYINGLQVYRAELNAWRPTFPCPQPAPPAQRAGSPAPNIFQQMPVDAGGGVPKYEPPTPQQQAEWEADDVKAAAEYVATVGNRLDASCSTDPKQQAIFKEFTRAQRVYSDRVRSLAERDSGVQEARKAEQEAQAASQAAEREAARPGASDAAKRAAAEAKQKYDEARARADALRDATIQRIRNFVEQGQSPIRAISCSPPPRRTGSQTALRGQPAAVSTTGVGNGTPSTFMPSFNIGFAGGGTNIGGNGGGNPELVSLDTFGGGAIIDRRSVSAPGRQGAFGFFATIEMPLPFFSSPIAAGGGPTTLFVRTGALFPTNSEVVTPVSFPTTFPAGSGTVTIKDGTSVPLLFGFGIPVARNVAVQLGGGGFFTRRETTVEIREAGAAGTPSFRTTQSQSFFDPAFTGGVRVGVADLNNDGKNDLILGLDTIVRRKRDGDPVLLQSPNFTTQSYTVASGRSGTDTSVLVSLNVDLSSFFAFEPRHRGGVFVGR
jgi:hypothetical protein